MLTRVRKKGAASVLFGFGYEFEAGLRGFMMAASGHFALASIPSVCLSGRLCG